jgi:NitT/TauT family transport system permease protein
MGTSFALALALAVPLGLALGRSRIVTAFFNRLLMTIYPVSKAAPMPIITLWPGIGDAPKTLVILRAVSLPVIYQAYQGARAVESTYQGMRAVEPKLVWSALGAGRRAREPCSPSYCQLHCRRC